MSLPSILESKPAPFSTVRPFKGRKLPVWRGSVQYESISGWVENPRIALLSKRKKEQVGDRDLTQDEVFEMMKNDSEVRLKSLRDDIIANGLKEPLILSNNGTLLDGNRRYFALRYILEEMDNSDPNRRDFEFVEVYMLGENCSEEDEQLVLVEENFSASLKQEWPDYVKAMFIKDDYDAGIPAGDIAKKYGWAKRKVSETIRIIDLIDEFVVFAMDPPNKDDEYGGGLGMSENDAEAVASENYQYFNEAQKSFYDVLKSDPEFKIHFFRWINEGVLSGFPEVRIAYKAWQDSRARSVLMSGQPTAGKEAKAIIDYNERVIRAQDEADLRLDDFTKYLEGLSAAEMSSISEEVVDRLGGALSLVIDMAKSSKKPT